MLNHHSLEAVAAVTRGPAEVWPAYGGYCFAGLPDTVLALFGRPARAPLPADVLPSMGRVQRVVLILVDACGWRLCERLAERDPGLRALLEGSLVSQLTAQFPSTTAAHITCLHSGRPVAQSGVPEWFYYEPEVDAVIAPLLFSYAGDGERERLARFGVPAERLLPPALYPQLAEAGVAAHIFQSREYARSTYSERLTRGAHLHAFNTLAEVLVNLELQLERSPAPTYSIVYVDTLDLLGHHYGPASRAVAAEARSLFRQLQEFLDACRGRFPGTLFLLTADHGQIAADPARVLDLGQRVPELAGWVRRDRLGRPVYFGGSARDLFLYVPDEHLAAAQARLTEALAGRARVWRTADLIAQGLFGPGPLAPRLAERLGTLLVLPEPGELAYWNVPGRFQTRHRGHHGGLTPDEMLIPFIAREL